MFAEDALHGESARMRPRFRCKRPRNEPAVPRFSRRPSRDLTGAVFWSWLPAPGTSYLILSTAKNGARIVVDKRSLRQRKALNDSRLRLLILGVLVAFLVVEFSRAAS